MISIQPETIIEIIRGLTVFMIVKVFLIIAMLMYTGFAVVMIRQVGVMTEAIESGANALVKMAAWVHLAMAILLVVVAVVIL